MRAAVHPSYNAVLLRAVRGWKFLPARRQGTPVRYLKVVDIYLKPWVRGVILLLALIINVYALRLRSRGSR